MLDTEFHERREKEERKAAAACFDLAIGNIHVDLANQHANKARASRQENDL